MSPPVEESLPSSPSGLPRVHPVTGTDLFSLLEQVLKQQEELRDTAQRVFRQQEDLRETVLNAFRGTIEGKPGVHQRLDTLETTVKAISESRQWATRLVVGLVLAALIPIGFALLRASPQVLPRAASSSEQTRE